MPNKITKPAISEFHPGQQASAGRPAYCYITGVAWWESGAYVGVDSYGITTQTMTPAEAQAQLRAFQQAQGKGFSSSYRLVCFPEVPPQPQIKPYNRVDMRPGWNASADSIFNQLGDFAFTFDYDRFPVGVIVGIAAYPMAGTLPSTVAAGVYLRDGAIEVVAAGIVVATAPYKPSEQPPIVIARHGGRVVVRVADWQYDAPGVPVVQVAQIRTLLYIAGDYIDNPQFIVDSVGRARGHVGLVSRVPEVSRARGSVGLRAAKKRARGSVAMRGRASSVIDLLGKARGSVATGGVIGPPGATGRATLGGLTVYGGSAGSTPRGSAKATLPPLMVDASSGYSIPVWAGGAVGLPGLMLGGVFQVGEIGSADLALPGLVVVGADRPYGQGKATLPALQVFGLAPRDKPGHLTMYETISYGDRNNATGLLYAVLDSSLEVGSSITFSLMLGAALYDSLLLRDRVTFAATLEAVLRSGIALSDQAARGDWSAGNAHYAAVQYATNVMTGAVTRFDGFNFSGFCRVGQETYGVSADGLYRIGHNEAPIDAIVEFAAIGGESAASKKLSYVYVGLATDGAVYVAVEDDDGGRQVYEAVENREMWRAQAAKGVTSRQWTVTLQLSQATQAELDSIEWIAPSTARRFGR